MKERRCYYSCSVVVVAVVVGCCNKSKCVPTMTRQMIVWLTCSGRITNTPLTLLLTNLFVCPPNKTQQPRNTGQFRQGSPPSAIARSGNFYPAGKLPNSFQAIAQMRFGSHAKNIRAIRIDARINRDAPVSSLFKQQTVAAVHHTLSPFTLLAYFSVREVVQLRPLRHVVT